MKNERNFKGKYTDPPTLDISFEKFITINGVNFTPREIDVIAYLCNGRTNAKIIATSLSIAPKTAEVHIRNIFAKIGNRTRDGIVSFIEKSDQDTFIKRHYKNLQDHAAFKQILKQVKQTVIKQEQQPSCLIIYWQGYENLQNSATKLENFLREVGIKSRNEAQTSFNNLTGFISKPFPEGIDKIIFIIPDEMLLKIQNSFLDGPEKPQNSHRNITLPLSDIHNKLFVLQDRKETTFIPQEIKEAGYIELREKELCYGALINLLKSLLAEMEWKNIEANFKGQGDIYKTLSNGSPFLVEESSISDKSRFIGFLKRGNNLLFFSSLLTIVILFALIFIGNHKEFGNNTRTYTIRSDLIIPVENLLLKRPELITEIEKKLNSNNGIKTVTLVGVVGMGGVGKTTLARHFGRLYKASVVWEINAETKTSLINSFKDLAYALTKTEKQRKEFNFIEGIQNTEEKEKQLLFFVKQQLNAIGNWLLIFDNVESFEGIKSYLPHDETVWGPGKVILTTRNANFKENHYITDSIIQLDKLTPEQALTLFSKVLYSYDFNQLSLEQIEKTITFLKEIPPFPLDVSIAASHIKNKNMSYSEYSKDLKESKEDFLNDQEVLLKEVNIYSKTRYGIISSLFKELLTIHPDFKTLLLLICLLDSQNIPLDLLEFYKDKSVVTRLMQELKKYSLITSESLGGYNQGKINAFSIHRSTQEMGLVYLMKILKLGKDAQFISDLGNIFLYYVNKNHDQENTPMLHLLKNHCNSLVNCALLEDSLKISFYYALGELYGANYEWQKAEEIISKTLLMVEKAHGKDHIEYARSLVALGGNKFCQTDYKEAIQLIEQGIPLYKKYTSLKDTFLANAYQNLGKVYRNIGNNEKALETFKKSRSIYAQYQSQMPAKYASVQTDIGVIYRISGHYQKAEDFLQQSFKIIESHGIENNCHRPLVLTNLGSIKNFFGFFNDAKNLLEESIAIYKKRLPEYHPNIFSALTNLGIAYMHLNQDVEAEKLLKECDSYFDSKPNHIDREWAKSHLANFHKKKKNYKEAEKLLKVCLDGCENKYGKDHLHTAHILMYLAEVYISDRTSNIQALDKAEELLKTALVIFQKHHHDVKYRCLEALADLNQRKLVNIMEPDSSQQVIEIKNIMKNYLQQALEIVKDPKHFPPNSPHISRIQGKLDEL